MVRTKIMRPFAIALILSFCGQAFIPIHAEVIQEVEIAGDTENEESKKGENEPDKLKQKFSSSNLESILSGELIATRYYGKWATPLLEINNPPPEVI